MTSSPFIMNAFHGKDLASLVFLSELMQISFNDTPEDLLSDYHTSADTLMREASTAHQQDGAFQGKALTYTENKTTTHSFLDLSLSTNLRQGTRQLFNMISKRWRSMYPIAHPRFGHFKFVYTPLATIDYESCFSDEGPSHIMMSSVVKYPRPSSSWLHVVSNSSTRIDSESGIIDDTDSQVMKSNSNCLDVITKATKTHADSPIPTQPENLEVSKKIVYIPPHKRESCDVAHSRAHSESTITDNKRDVSVRDKKRYLSLDLTSCSPWQTNPARQTFTGSSYVPRPGFPGFEAIPGSLHTSANGSITETFPKETLSDQSKYRGKGQGTKAIKDLDNNLNCSVFVSHLPKFVHYREIFAMITTGSVISLHVMGPIPECPFSAAKIVFKYPEGAARFIKEANSRKGIEIRNHRLSVIYNEHGMVKHSVEHQSRVLHIKGPYKKMTEAFWRLYFNQITKYQLEYVGYLPVDEPSKGKRAMEFRFARVEAQAQSILLTIIHDPQIGGTVAAKYGEDPCGRGWDTLSEIWRT